MAGRSARPEAFAQGFEAWVPDRACPVTIAWWESRSAGVADMLTPVCNNLSGPRMTGLAKVAFRRAIGASGLAGASRVGLLRECRQTIGVLERLIQAKPGAYRIALRVTEIDADFRPIVECVDHSDDDLAEAMFYLEPVNHRQVAQGMERSSYDRIFAVMNQHVQHLSHTINQAWQ